MATANCILSLKWPPSTADHAPRLRARGSYRCNVVTCIQKTVAQLETTKILRRSANYKPSICDDNFRQSLSSKYEEPMYKNQAEKLKDYARSLLLEGKDGSSNLELIDTLQRLGLGHIFEEEINNVIENMLIIDQGKQDDLHFTALRFRILRQHGHMISQDLFSHFLDENGAFVEGFKEDTWAILSLYDASYLSIEGEMLMDDARSFATKHLREYMIKGNPNCELHRLVEHALELPHYWRNPKYEARWFIGEYERKEKKNPNLLELAKLVFNIYQAGYQCRVKAKSRWWKDHGIAEQLPFTRDRLPECYLWSLGYVSEPQYGLSNDGLTTVNQLITTIDDIYDIYGTIEELELFTNALERWDLRVLDELPEYMRTCYLALFNFVGEVGYTTLKRQGRNIISTLSKSWADLCKGYLVEAKWHHEGYMPSFDKYMDNAWRTISLTVIITHAFFLTNQKITEERLALINSYYDFIQMLSYIFRLLDDLATSNDELARRDVPKAVQCYMHEKGVSEEAAREHVKHIISESWKKLNKHLVLGSPFPRSFVRATMDVLRAAHWFYLHGDGFGYQQTRTFDMFKSLLNPSEWVVNMNQSNYCTYKL